jgi:hypothetical protein
MYVESVRFLTLTPVVGALALGGVALAQPVEILDPWNHSADEGDGWFAPETKSPESPLDGERADARARPTAPPATEIAGGAGALDHAAVTLRMGPRAAARVAPMNASPAEDVSLLDPWAPPVVASETPSLARAVPRSTGGRALAWPSAERLVEVVDPWKRMPEFAPSERVRLILDPWAL